MIVECRFIDFTFNSGEKFYGCFISDKVIPEDQVLEFIGEHEYGKSNVDVIKVQFLQCAVTKVPQGLSKIFPNMKILEIWSSKLKKLSKADLSEFNHLERLTFGSNELEFLPGDLFEGFKNLEWISFWGNKLQFIEPNILDGLGKLKFVDFGKNQNYGKAYSEYSVYESNATLQEIKNELYEMFYERFNFLQDLRSSEQNLNLKFNEGRIFGDLKNYISDENSKDFKLEIDGSEFPVHKFLLAARSPTLAEMLRNNPEAENLKLVDISVDIFEVILKFLYTDELPGVEGTNFLHLFAASNRLDIKGLQNFAAENLLAQVNDKNAVEVLLLSNKYGHNGLRQTAFKEIKNNYTKIEFEDDWATDTEKVTMIIMNFKKKEEVIKKIEEDFKKLMSKGSKK